MDSNNNPSEQTQPSFMPAPPVSVSPVMPEPARKNLGGLWIVILLFVVAIAAAYYFIVYRQNNSDQADLENVVFASEFAPYEEISVNMSPKVPAYKVAADLSNVENIEGFSYGLDQPLKDMLAKNGFAVKPGYDAEFFSLYEKNRYNFTPNFVTTDSLLHNYHLLFDHLLRTLEEDRFFAELKSLNERMLAMSLEQYNEAGARGTDWENAAKRNVGFFAVGSKLLDNSVAIPDIVKAEVEEELMLIDAHSGITLSPVMNMNSQGDILGDIKEDYSQYIPRGHYEKSDKLKAYFRSMMWYGRLTFRLENDDEIKSAILITSGLHKEVNRVSWDKLYEPISFFVGKADDITYKEFGPIYNQVYGKALLSDVIKDKNKFQIFKDEAKKLDPPQINSMPIFNSDIQPDREAEIKGFRFLGQRFTIDAAIFQRLIDRDVPGRMLPRGLDIPAAFGSDEALAILTEMGETKYPNYSENMGKMRTYLKGLSGVVWNQNLYWGWMYTLRSLIGEKPAGYPSFMLNKAWVRKELNTMLGSWTELKHDTILYAKQSYAEMGGGEPEARDDRGYVEPNPLLYARLASLLRMTVRGLETRNLLSGPMKDNLSRMEQLALSLKTISEKELNNETLSEAEYELIRSYGGQIEHFWLEVNKDEPEFKQSDRRSYLWENPAALVADVATDPNGSVLEEATGFISEIYVVVPIDGKLRLTRGGVYSYYEFPWPIGGRLTDKKWRDMLSSENKPSLPSWTSSFIAN